MPSRGLTGDEQIDLTPSSFGLPLIVIALTDAAGAAVYGMAWQAITYALYLVASGMGKSMVAHSAGKDLPRVIVLDLG